MGNKKNFLFIFFPYSSKGNFFFFLDCSPQPVLELGSEANRLNLKLSSVSRLFYFKQTGGVSRDSIFDSLQRLENLRKKDKCQTFVLLKVCYDVLGFLAEIAVSVKFNVVLKLNFCEVRVLTRDYNVKLEMVAEHHLRINVASIEVFREYFKFKGYSETGFARNLTQDIRNRNLRLLCISEEYLCLSLLNSFRRSVLVNQLGDCSLLLEIRVFQVNVVVRSLVVPSLHIQLVFWVLRYPFRENLHLIVKVWGNLKSALNQVKVKVFLLLGRKTVENLNRFEKLAELLEGELSHRPIFLLDADGVTWVVVDFRQNL